MHERGRIVTWRETRGLIREDLRRRLRLEGRAATWWHALGVAAMPGVVCVVAYRLSTFLELRGHRALSRILQDLQHLYTGIEIHPGSIIGPGLVFGDRPGGGIAAHCTLGANCTVLGGSTMTIGGVDELHGHAARIVLGDHCIVGVGVRIIGVVTLAAATQIKPNSVVVQSFPVPGSVLDGVPARRRAVVPVADVMRWNPLRPWLSVPV